MKKMISCPNCSGRGIIVAEYLNAQTSAVCPGCNGLGVQYVPMSNADHIRSMTDEELELWLVRFCRAAEDCIVCPIDDCPHERNERWIEWLKQPYKEEA